MAMMQRPEVSTFADGGKYWEYKFEKFLLKTYIPATDIDGEVNNYTFRAPLLLVFEEKEQDKEDRGDTELPRGARVMRKGLCHDDGESREAAHRQSRV